jgi:hypothetical protein
MQLKLPVPGRHHAAGVHLRGVAWEVHKCVHSGADEPCEGILHIPSREKPFTGQLNIVSPLAWLC